MNVGIIVDNELNSDVRVLREIRILKESGYNIFVLCFDFQKLYKEPVSGINITRIAIHRKLKDILFFFLNTIPVYEWLWSINIKKLILNNNLEVLHVHDLYMSRAAHSGILKSGRKIPLILDLHENYPFTVTTYNWTKGLLRRLFSRPDAWKSKEGEYLGYADRIIVLSSEFRDSLLNQYPSLVSDTFVVLPNVPDLSVQLREKRNTVKNLFKNDYPTIFYYGVIAERRGIFDALSVFTDLVNEKHQVNFLLIGPVDKMDRPLFSQYINQEALTGKIHYIPWIESIEFPDYLDICDICVAPFHKNPQHESGVANKIYEYMLGGKPIIASDCKPQQNLIEGYNCGLIFRNLQEFHDAIITLLQDRSLRETMGNNGKKAILVNFNTDTVKNQLFNLYNQLPSYMKRVKKQS
jgi:glycosyltransferase involved in cell wall biosynthesis